ncbi:unnamed protein product [Microthlaspi erraticum]|uniref:NB-ARC domain-containing protein n=1 Tax=Microthlaspi erraticum TaxID=1685480 RepID=A0A6D2K6X2_9BRAS|nr:unnamed protein product [Microthlaspi erraticum]
MNLEALGEAMEDLRLSVKICNQGSQERRKEVGKSLLQPSLISSYRYGEKVSLTLQEVEELKSKEFGERLESRFPAPENRCKVVFTTRRQDVCDRMGLKTQWKSMLGGNEAFDLFQKKVGQRTLGRHRIPELAKDIARKCGGLPLALNVIGETMSCKRRWKNGVTR